MIARMFVFLMHRSGSVTLRLANRGPEAYRPEEYGDSISIERRILRDGGGGYKIMSVNSTISFDL
jgi:hypothetical protein